ncbi:site-specific integrase [Streptomyces mirabilis]|uniref:tyrosine-type recombinase/integrase n=1 Tax=Streptomyces mirabilis TaxID=68239 RepID=UPI00342F1BF3
MGGEDLGDGLIGRYGVAVAGAGDADAELAVGCRVGFAGPPSVAAALAQYFMEYPAAEVELPWGGPEPDRETKKFPLVITTTYGNALRANIFNVEVWKPALAAAGVIPLRKQDERWKASRKDGFHVLRHTYASVILEAGESVVTLARWLGHSSPTITLDHYAHFMPEAGGKGRGAIDALLGQPAAVASAPRLRHSGVALAGQRPRSQESAGSERG